MYHNSKSAEAIFNPNRLDRILSEIQEMKGFA